MIQTQIFATYRQIVAGEVQQAQAALEASIRDRLWQAWQAGEIQLPEELPADAPMTWTAWLEKYPKMAEAWQRFTGPMVIVQNDKDGQKDVLLSEPSETVAARVATLAQTQIAPSASETPLREPEAASTSDDATAAPSQTSPVGTLTACAERADKQTPVQKPAISEASEMAQATKEPVKKGVTVTPFSTPDAQASRPDPAGKPAPKATAAEGNDETRSAFESNAVMVDRATLAWKVMEFMKQHQLTYYSQVSRALNFPHPSAVSSVLTFPTGHTLTKWGAYLATVFGPEILVSEPLPSTQNTALSGSASGI